MKKIVRRFKKKRHIGRFWRFCLTILGILVFLITQLLNYPITCFGSNTSSSVFTFLRIGEGARPVAMGEAFTTMVDDVNSIYWNPAGLGRITHQEITASYLSHIVDINSGYFGYVLPMSTGGLGLGIVYLDYGKIEETTGEEPTGEGLGYYRPSDIAMIVSYGAKVSNKLNLGISVKGIYEKIQDYTANGVAIDLGTLYKLPIKDSTFGFTVKNLGLQTKAFIEEKHNLPLVFDVGLGYNMFSKSLTPKNFGSRGKSLKLGLDLSIPQDGDFNVNIGGEYNWRGLVFLRMGYRSMGEDLKTGSDKDSLTGLSAGLGLNMKSYQLDYAFVPFNELGDTHRVSLGMKWGRRDDRNQIPEARYQRKETRREGVRHYKKGQRYCKERKYKEAIKKYKKAIKKGYKTAKVYANMGYCYHKLGKKIAAKKAYKKALKLDPSNKTIKKNLRRLTKR